MAELIRITAKRDGFRRMGLAHPGTPTDYPADHFTAEQLAVLQAEPMLVVEIRYDPPGSEDLNTKRSESLNTKTASLGYSGVSSAEPHTVPLDVAHAAPSLAGASESVGGAAHAIKKK